MTPPLDMEFLILIIGLLWGCYMACIFFCWRYVELFKYSWQNSLKCQQEQIADTTLKANMIANMLGQQSQQIQDLYKQLEEIRPIQQ